MMTSTLGFTVRLIASGEDLRDACLVRAQAYGRHLPELGQRLAEPDELDFEPGTTVFICRDKATGRATGTMRIQSSLHCPDGGSWQNTDRPQPVRRVHDRPACPFFDL